MFTLRLNGGLCMTRVGLIKPAEVKKPQAETKPKEPAQDSKKK